MPLYGLTVVARDAHGPHYVNHTVRAASLEQADAIVADLYAKGDEELLEFDQAVEFDGDDQLQGLEGVIESLGKVYFEDA